MAHSRYGDGQKQQPEAPGPAIRQHLHIGGPVGLRTLDFGPICQDKRCLLRKELFPRRTWIRAAQKRWMRLEAAWKEPRIRAEMSVNRNERAFRRTWLI